MNCPWKKLPSQNWRNFPLLKPDSAKYVFFSTITFLLWETLLITSLKSQKFTWPLASVYISFDKLKTDFYDFFLFYSKNWMVFMFSWIFQGLVELSFLSSFWCFIQVFHVLFKFYSSLCLIKDSIFIYKLWSKSAYNYAKVHTSRINYIQVGLSAYIRNVTCRTAYMRKRSKNWHFLNPPFPYHMISDYAIYYYINFNHSLK